MGFHSHFYRHEQIEEPWLLIIQSGHYDFRGSLAALKQTTIAFYSQASKCALFLFIVATQTTMKSKCMKRIKGKYLAEDFLQSFTI